MSMNALIANRGAHVAGGNALNHFRQGQQDVIQQRQQEFNNALTTQQHAQQTEQHNALMQQREQEQQLADSTRQQAYASRGYEIMSQLPDDESRAAAWQQFVNVGRQSGLLGEGFANQYSPEALQSLAFSGNAPLDSQQAERFGLNPIYGTDNQGNTVAYQLGDGGTMRELEGFTPAAGTRTIDRGSHVDVIDAKTGQLIRSEEKALAPDKTLDYARDKEIATETGKQFVADEAKSKAAKIAYRDASSAHQNLIKNKRDLGLVFGKFRHFRAITPELIQRQENMQASLDRMVGIIRLAEVGKLKGTGPITENEQKMLAQAATALQNQNIDPEAAEAEMGRVMRVMKGRFDFGDDSAAAAPVSEAGGWQTLDGGIRIRKKQ